MQVRGILQRNQLLRCGRNRAAIAGVKLLRDGPAASIALQGLIVAPSVIGAAPAVLAREDPPTGWSYRGARGSLEKTSVQVQHDINDSPARTWNS